MPFSDRAREWIGKDLYVSDWRTIGQVELDVFSALTRDWDYMHNDPSWAKAGPWGATIVHGYFLVSLVSGFLGEAGFPTVATEDERVMNYGLDRVRFTAPVRTNEPFRARVRIDAVTVRKPGVDMVKSRVTLEGESEGSMFMAADVLILCVSGDAVMRAR